jgi:hypothetical protein
MRTRVRRNAVQPGRWAHNLASEAKRGRRAGRSVLKLQGAQARQHPDLFFYPCDRAATVSYALDVDGYQGMTALIESVWEKLNSSDEGR